MKRKTKVSNEEKRAILAMSSAKWTPALVSALNDKELNRAYKDVCKVVATAKRIAVRRAKRAAAKDARLTFGVVSPFRKAFEMVKDTYDQSLEEVTKEQYEARVGIVADLKEVKSF